MRNLLFLCFLFGTIPALAKAGTEQACPPTPTQKLALPHPRGTLAAKRPAIIVAIGSSSTAGAMASNPGNSYPADLQDELTNALPAAEISVINRGINGEDAGREGARMVREVIALRPDLVIWQVGANAVARHEPVSQFTPLVERGLLMPHEHETDVVLMDNQRSPQLLASSDNPAIDATLAQLAHVHGASLFSRDTLMRSWADTSDLPDFLAPDGMHLNDRGYRCTAEALSRAILLAVR